MFTGIGEVCCRTDRNVGGEIEEKRGHQSREVNLKYLNPRNRISN